MAKVYITEYCTSPKENGILLQAPQEPALTTQTVAIGGASAQSSAFNAKTKFVRIHADAVCSILFGENPTATANSPRLAAGVSEYFGVIPGQKIAVITNS
jgi:hypothetical protein